MRFLAWLAAWLSPLLTLAESQPPIAFPQLDLPTARVVISRNTNATQAFQAQLPQIKTMVAQGLTVLTGKSSTQNAWKSLLSTQDIIGIKVFSLPGPNSGTRLEVVAAVVESLLTAGFQPQNLIIWDKKKSDLRNAGFVDLAAQYGIRTEGSADAGYDENAFYETSLLGNLVFGDAEFGLENEGVGRKSFVSRLVTKEITRIINIPPLLNHNRAGVTGTLYSLAIGSVDNTLRFERSPTQLAVAVPELYALPELSDRVALNIVDALVCQYQGEQRSLLHYSTTLNELRFSTDPVALDILSLTELEHQRQRAKVAKGIKNIELYHNASLLELGVSNPTYIRVEVAPE